MPNWGFCGNLGPGTRVPVVPLCQRPLERAQPVMALELSFLASAMLPSVHRFLQHTLAIGGGALQGSEALKRSLVALGEA